MWDVFHRAHVEANPGVNLNDVERVFLSALLGGLVRGSDYSFSPYSNAVKESQKLIETIR